MCATVHCLPPLQMLVASVKIVRANYCCPDEPPTLHAACHHVRAYFKECRETAGHASDLERVLGTYCATFLAGSHLGALRALQAVAEDLSGPAFQQRVQRQLEELAGGCEQQQPLLTVQQLQYHCYSCILRYALTLPTDSLEQLLEMKAAAVASAEQLRQQEPNNPMSHFGHAATLVTESFGLQPRRAVKCFLRAFHLGLQQMSDYWSVCGAAGALVIATRCPLEVGHSLFAAALNAFEQTAEAALRRCTRLLPVGWVVILEQQVRQGAPLLPGAHNQLRLLARAGNNPRASQAASRAVLASAVAQLAILNELAATNEPNRHDGFVGCDGWGQRAVGVRRCARFKQAQYCRCAAGLHFLHALLCLMTCQA
jgi:hypothetical protein